jgi:hypothetical protein
MGFTVLEAQLPVCTFHPMKGVCGSFPFNLTPALSADDSAAALALLDVAVAAAAKAAGEERAALVCRVTEIVLSRSAIVPMQLVAWLCSGRECWSRLQLCDCPHVVAEVIDELLREEHMQLQQQQQQQQQGRICPVASSVIPLLFNSLTEVNFNGSGGMCSSNSSNSSSLLAIIILALVLAFCSDAHHVAFPSVFHV